MERTKTELVAIVDYSKEISQARRAVACAATPQEKFARLIALAALEGLQAGQFPQNNQKRI